VNLIGYIIIYGIEYGKGVWQGLGWNLFHCTGGSAGEHVLHKYTYPTLCGDSSEDGSPAEHGGEPKSHL